MTKSNVKVDTAKLQATIPFFNELDANVVDRILPYIVEKTYRKGAIIFLQGDAGDEIFFIRSGAINIYTFEGMKKVVFAYLREGDYFGEMALIKPGLVRSATAEAMATTKVLTLRRTDFENLIEANPRLAIHLLDYTMERLRQANQQVYDMTFLNVRTRIVKKLATVSNSPGSKQRSEAPVEWKVTHQQLAEMVGAVRETVSKVLLELQEEGLIETRNKLIIIPDPSQLQKKLLLES
ncbi:Crp/Fnr family transcriptional regulator [Paenibacillus oenotherae]|uniref:Crp/Fnr family transcriptional regulator n=1 Tax=Paenibacillus oenotherae TaxID=1435645 RepID=UPI001FE9B317|nr:Crp/Fnr family transcriptional regulator [Paenibacillus oenotherae]